MIQRLLRSRGWRKFRRNRMALLSCGVILVYALIAVTVLIGGFFQFGVTVDSVKERVMLDKYPGFFGSVSAERRTADLVDRFEVVSRQVDQARDASDPMLTMRIRDWAERRFIDDFDRIVEIRDDLYETYEALLYASDDVAALEEELVFIDEDLENAEGDDRDLLLEDRALVEADLEAARLIATTAPDELEAGLLEMQPMPTGLDGFVYFLRTSLGSDDKGASVLFKSLYSTKIAFQIGVVTAVVSVLLGTLLGASAGFFGGWVDHVVMWIVSTFSSVPYLVLLAVIVFMFSGTEFDNAERPALSLVPVYVAFCATFWISTCRVIRGEVMKIKELEYVQAATAIGFGRFYILIKHVVPNTVHIMFINFSLLFIGAIKSEVILSFLGLGVKGQPSWGIMIAHGKSHVTSGFFWEVLSATGFMVGLVLAFNIVSDALQDAFDPKHVS